MLKFVVLTVYIANRDSHPCVVVLADALATPDIRAVESDRSSGSMRACWVLAKGGILALNVS